jgi:alpha-D-ribose 1-methylphosphonate 5-triphosphate synthase subunit PhnG
MLVYVVAGGKYWSLTNNPTTAGTADTDWTALSSAAAAAALKFDFDNLDTWVITHNLNAYPDVTTVNTTTVGGTTRTVFYGDVTYTSLNVATVTMTAPMTGYATVRL